jgi:hypothetical protein
MTWAIDEYRAVLEGHCAEYMTSTKGERAEIIDEIVEMLKGVELHAGVKKPLPEGLEKVCKLQVISRIWLSSLHKQKVENWYRNYGKQYLQGSVQVESAKGHKKAFTTRTVFWRKYEDRIREVLGPLRDAEPDKTKKNLTFQAAVTTIWNELSEEEQDECRKLAHKYNSEAVPVEMQQRSAFVDD